jgi:hypothetical protein
VNPGLTVLHAVQPTDAGVAGYVAAVAADQLARGWRVVVTCPGGGRLAAELAAYGYHDCTGPRRGRPARTRCPRRGAWAR